MGLIAEIMLLLEGFGDQGITPCVICIPPRDLYHTGSPVRFEDTGGRQSLFGSMTYHFSVFWGDFLIHVMQRHDKFVRKPGWGKIGLECNGRAKEECSIRQSMVCLRLEIGVTIQGPSVYISPLLGLGAVKMQQPLNKIQCSSAFDISI